MHHDVGGDASKRLLESMREMLDSDEMPEPPQNGKPHFHKRHTSVTFCCARNKNV